MKKFFNKRNIFYFIQFCIILFGVSFPFWQTAEIVHIYKPLWVMLPSAIFMIMFTLAFGTVFDIQGRFEKILKKIVSYWLAGGFILFFTFLLFLFLNIFLGLEKEIIFSLVVVVSSILIIYAYHHASKIFIHALSIETDKVTRSYRILQLSDIHIGSNGKHEVQKIVDKLKNLSFDCVILTGDLIDEDYASYTDLEPLNQISEPMYYITGNHEYYLRHKNFKDFIQKTNIHDVNNQKVDFHELEIFGIDEKSSVGTVLDDLGVDGKKGYQIMLLHEPDTKKMEQASKRGIDMAFSGHTHNGQIFPFTWMVRGRYQFLKGLYQLGSMYIYVSQGTGTWGPKMRLGTSNEITLVHIQPKK